MKLAAVTLEDLREVLWKELDDLREGKTTIRRSNAVAKLAQQILDSARLEIQTKWTHVITGSSTKLALGASPREKASDP